MTREPISVKSDPASRQSERRNGFAASIAFGVFYFGVWLLSFGWACESARSQQPIAPLYSQSDGLRVIAVPSVAMPAPQDVQLQSNQDRITLITRDAPLSSVLALIAQQQGLNIVSGEEMNGKVTITLNDVRLNDALNSILAIHGFAWSRQNNIITVASMNSEKRLSPTVHGRLVRVFSLNYVNAADVNRVVQGLMSPVGQSFVTDSPSTDSSDGASTGSGYSSAGGLGGSNTSATYGTSTSGTTGAYGGTSSSSSGGSSNATVQLRSSQGQLVVEDIPAYLDRIANYIAQVDVMPRQVIVEANILQVTLRDNNRHGVNLNQLARVSKSDVTLQTMGLATGSQTGAAMKVAGTDLTSLIELLKATNDTKTLASPKVAVLNGQEARISVGGKLGYLQTTATTTSTLQSVSFLDYGVVLKVTPIITEDGQVLMNVAPQVSTGRINATSKLPETESTEVQTKVMLSDGQAIVIGGLIKETNSDGQNKVPWLGDLWLVGRLFQSRDQLRERNEIIITLLPRIATPNELCALDDGGDIAQATTPLMDNYLNPVDRSAWEGQLADASHKPKKRWWPFTRKRKTSMPPIEVPTQPTVSNATLLTQQQYEPYEFTAPTKNPDITAQPQPTSIQWTESQYVPSAPIQFPSHAPIP